MLEPSHMVTANERLKCLFDVFSRLSTNHKPFLAVLVEDEDYEQQRSVNVMIHTDEAV